MGQASHDDTAAFLQDKSGVDRTKVTELLAVFTLLAQLWKKRTYARVVANSTTTLLPKRALLLMWHTLRYDPVVMLCCSAA